MKKEDLFEALGDVNIQYIKEAHRKDEERNSFSWTKWGLIAASLTILALSIPMLTYLLHSVGKNKTTIGIAPFDTGKNVQELQADNDEKTNQSEKTNRLVVNEVEGIMSTDMDVEITSLEKMPVDVWNSVLEDFKKTMGISYEGFIGIIPDSYECVQFYSVSTRGYKDTNLQEEYRLHDYVFEYQTKNDGKVTIAICSFEEPLRDYRIDCENPQKTEINGCEATIYNYQNVFMTQFSCRDIHYDIETSNITLEEFEKLLESIIKNSEAVE